MNQGKIILIALALTGLPFVFFLLDSDPENSADLRQSFGDVFGKQVGRDAKCGERAISLYSLVSSLHNLSDSSRAFLGASFGSKE